MAEKEDLVEIIGSEGVSDAPEILAEYSKDKSFVPPIEPRCVVKPKTTEDVQRIIKWANDTLTPLIPVSSGSPRFRGDTVPTAGGAAVLDLSGMKKILWIDRRNRVAMIEPGVTFGELRPEVEKEGLRLLMPLLPRRSKSVLASALEREPIIIPRYHWDIGDPMLCTEVVFGTGDLFRTGAAAGPGTLEEQRKSGQAQKNPAGPSQASLHRVIQGSQGTMGCVTWITLKTQLLPKLQKPFLVGSHRLDSLTELSHWLIRLRIADECLVLNNSNLAAIMAKKWPEEYRRLRDNLPSWILFFCQAGYEYFPEERLAYEEEYMSDIAQRIGVSPVEVLSGVSAYELLAILQAPSEEPYWKLRHKGSCHDIFFLTGRDRLPELIEVMHNLASRYGYPALEMGIYIQPVVQGTSWHCEFNLFFDPDDLKETETVRTLSVDAVSALMAEGAFFSRPYGPWADIAYRRDGETTAALRKVKGIFDPNNIMNPGKLCF